MDRNPYAHQDDTPDPRLTPGQQGRDRHTPDHFGPGEKPRQSVTAIVGLVLSLICCMPGVIGAGLGAIALVGINRSGGTVKGKGSAIAAIAVGSLTTIVQTLVVVSAINETAAQARTLELMELFDSGEPAAIAAEFDTTVRAEITPEAIETFRATYTDTLGPYRGQLVFLSMDVIMRAGFSEVEATEAFKPSVVDLSAPAEFDNGQAIVVMELGPIGIKRVLVYDFETGPLAELPLTEDPSTQPANTTDTDPAP